MKKGTFTEENAENSNTGGVLIGKRKGQTIIHNKGSLSGYLVGKTHAEGGIKAINKSTGQPLEMQGGEVVITAPAVADQTKHEFDGQMLTNREILSTINERGGGVSFAKGGDIPSEIYYNGGSYNYGGQTMTDYEIMQKMNECGCEHELKTGGHLSKGKSLKDIAEMHNVSLSHIKEQLKKGIEVESEHTSDKKEQIRIAKDHLVENPNYYTILEKVGLETGGEIEKALSDLEKAPSVKFWYEPTFDAESYSFEKYGKPNSFVNLQEDDISKTILAYDEQGKLVGVFKTRIFGDDKGAFKIVVREDAMRKGWGKKLLDEAENQNINIVGNIKNNSFSSRGRDLLRNWLNKKSKSYAHGGKTKKEDLVKDAKDGNNPARDLNNYNDVLDLQADGVVGGLTGLELSDGVGGADASGGVGAFDNGGEVEEYVKGGATLSAEVFEWDKVPTNYRNISKVKKVPFTNNPMDKGLDSIIAPFLGKDELRPVMSGINFDENGITATNAHILITLPYPNQKYEGIYDINRVKKIKADQPILIGGNYPNYEAVIPKSNIIEPYEIDVYKLLQYTKTAMNYANKTTRSISYKFGDNDRIGFNGSFLSDVLTASLKLGHEKLYAFITTPNRAMILSPKKDYELGSDEILLIMPIMLDSKFGTINGYGTNDPDYNRSIKAYFDFNDSEIHNADGSVAEFKMQYENNLSVDDYYLNLLSKITKKYYNLPILSYAKVENGKMTATDLQIYLVIKDVNMPDGIYEIVNKAPNITMQPIEDFPREKVFNKNESEKHFEFVTFSEVFEFYLDKLLLSVGKDDLRPVMSGICIKKTSDNKLFLVTTDAHTLCKINITEYCQFEKDNRESEYILPTKYLKDFVKLTDGSLHFKCNVSNIFIEADNLEYIARTIDGKYPNYDAIIPRETTKSITFDHVVMNKCMKSPEVSSQLTKYKGNKDIVFTLANEGNNLFLKVQKDKGYNMPFEFLDKIELCEIDFNYKQVNSNFSLNESLFLLMPFKDEFKENQYFSFRKDYFDKMLETITDTEVECYFTEPNRAYIFPIDAIDYKKTLPEEKKKEQKISETEMQKIEEALQLAEAIETLEILLETANRKDKKQIKEALEVLKMLNENN